MKYIFLILLLLINPASAIYIENLSVGLGNGAYLKINNTNVSEFILYNSTATFEYVLNGSQIKYTSLTNKTLDSPTFFNDNFTVYTSGDAGNLNISAIMNNATDNYNLTANSLFIEYKNSSDSALVWFNYTGSYPASLTIKWNYSYPAVYFILKGYITNVLEAPIEWARIDIDSTHEFTDEDGYYTFNNITKGNYTILVRQIGYRNNTANVSLNSTNDWYNVTLSDNKMPAIKMTPGFEGLGLLIGIGLIYIIRRKT